MKNTKMKSERVENWWCGFEWCILNTQKVWSSNKFKKMKSLCNRWVFVRNPDTSKETVRFVHEVHPVFAVTHSSFYNMLCGWKVDTMPTFNLFRVHLKCFSISVLFSSKKSVSAWKIPKWSQKGLKIDDVALNGAFWTHKKYGVQISSKKWNPFVTDEFSSETLILRKRLSVLYTKCIQFLP
jgi:hypothetical protein